MDVTLFELHVDEASFDASAPFSGRGGSSSTDDPTGDEAEGSRRRALGLLAFVGLLAVALWIRRNGTPDVAVAEDEGATITE